MAQLLKADDVISALTDGSIATLDALIAARTGAGAAVDYRTFHKEQRIGGAAANNDAAGYLTSLWQYEGTPCNGTLPGTTWANPTNATAGSFAQADPGGGRAKWLTYGFTGMNKSGMLIIYDRLGHVSGLSGTVTTAQNVNGGSAGAITRYTNGVGNHLWLEINTAIGVTATTFTCAYANQSGASKTSIATDIGAANHDEQARIIPVSLASGDSGVQSVTSVTLLATTGAAGDFGLVIAHPLFAIPLSSTGAGMAIAFQDGPIPKVLAGACLAMAFLCANNGASAMEFAFEMAEA